MGKERSAVFDAWLAAGDDRYEGSRDTQEGIIISTDPDYCYSPKQIVPYTIFAKQSDDANTAATVRMTGSRAHTSASLITTCYGDEAGTGGGVDSGTYKGVCRPKTWSSKIFIEGNHAVRDSDEWSMNNGNTVGILSFKVKSPSQAAPSGGGAAEGEAASSGDIDPIITAATATAAAPSIDGSKNLSGAIKYNELRETTKNWLPSSNFLTDAARAAKNMTGVGIFVGTLFAMNPNYRGAFADRWVRHRWQDPGFDGLYQDALDDFDRLDALGYDAGEQWYERWNNALSHYQERAQAGEYGSASQVIAEAVAVGAVPPEMQERLDRDRIIITGAVAAAAATQACQHLACPPANGSGYRGGAHWCTSQPIWDSLDSHHMPAQGYGNKFPVALGPAIQMEPADHRQTASNPTSWVTLGKDYNKQAAHLAVGQNYAAFRLDVEDITDVEIYIGQPGKYAAAVAQAEAYMNCLKANKFVQ